MKGVRHFLCMGDMKNANQIVVGFPEGQDDLGRRMYGIMILK
jgi:hypothetical protein